MENREFISVVDLPVAEGEEVSVLCVENGEMKQKPAKGLGGGFDLVVKLDHDNDSVESVSADVYHMIMDKVYAQEPVLIYIAVREGVFCEGFVASMIEPWQANEEPFDKHIRIYWYDEEYDYAVDLYPDGHIEYYGEA